MTGRKILIVDDDRDLAESLAEYLELDGHDVHVAFSGRSGRDAALSESFDSVLIDVGLPDLDGYRVMREILEQRPDLPVALMSGHSAQDLHPESAHLAMMDVIIKPIDLKLLSRRLADGTLGTTSGRARSPV